MVEELEDLLMYVSDVFSLQLPNVSAALAAPLRACPRAGGTLSDARAFPPAFYGTFAKVHPYFRAMRER